MFCILLFLMLLFVLLVVPCFCSFGLFFLRPTVPSAVVLFVVVPFGFCSLWHCSFYCCSFYYCSFIFLMFLRLLFLLLLFLLVVIPSSNVLSAAVPFGCYSFYYCSFSLPRFSLVPLLFSWNLWSELPSLTSFMCCSSLSWFFLWLSVFFWISRWLWIPCCTVHSIPWCVSLLLLRYPIVYQNFILVIFRWELWHVEIVFLLILSDDSFFLLHNLICMMIRLLIMHPQDMFEGAFPNPAKFLLVLWMIRLINLLLGFLFRAIISIMMAESPMMIGFWIPFFFNHLCSHQ